jgi:phenylpyruvate tautomerase PptA (4-oxalocrotonate tautomerase family)
MPFIHSIISFELGKEKKKILKTRIAKAMEETMGKGEQWLFVGFQEETLYFRGEEKEKAAVIEVKLLGSISKEGKEAFTKISCEIFSEELGISGDDIYVIFTEVERGNWGWNGRLL